MATFNCKMCGGALNIQPGATVATCDYCGARQTLPRLDNDRRVNLYDRANHFRRCNDYDKAMGLYELLLNEDRTDAEAYWSIVLCRYGIEYVEDPATHRRIPTVNRTQYTSIFADEDYKSALKYADEGQRAVYEAEAKAIDEIQRGILAVSQKEEPFDVFICYKETDDAGRRTPDSVLAGELYQELTEAGLKVFFSRVTLENKLGQEYEPVIFAALNSAKVMVVLGTRPAYFNAVWVKNEWSRYLALIRGGAKKVLIPAYRDMDPYDLPEEFSHLQAQDMSKLGFMQDLLRGIRKIVGADGQEERPAEPAPAGPAPVEPLLKRAFLFLEDGDWESADEYCERVLDQDPENGRAYLGKLMAEYRVGHQEALADCARPLEESGSYKKILRFGDKALCSLVTGYNQAILQRNEQQRLADIYSLALGVKKNGGSASFDQAAELFSSIAGYRDAQEQAELCREQAERLRQAEKEQQRRIEEAQEKKKTRFQVQCFAVIAAIVLIVIAGSEVKARQQRAANYERGISYLESNDADARDLGVLYLKNLGGYKDSEEILYNYAVKWIENGDMSGIELIEDLYARTDPQEALYTIGVRLIEEDNVNGAEVLEHLDGYKDSLDILSRFGAELVVACDPKGTKILHYLEAYQDPWPELYSYVEEQLANDSDLTHKIMVLSSIMDDCDSAKKSVKECLAEYWAEHPNSLTTLAASNYHLLGIRNGGKADALGNNDEGQCNVYSWANLVSVACGAEHSVGLTANGTVVAVGDNSYGQCDVSSWRGIVSIAAGDYYTIGVKCDGSVVFTGSRYSDSHRVTGWKDITTIATDDDHTVGLKSDGTVVAVGNNDYGQCDLDSWHHITAVAAGKYNTTGLKDDGTVVVASLNRGYNQGKIADWTDIIAVAEIETYCIGLKADGSVLLTSNPGKCDVSGWTDIVAIVASDRQIFGLRSDGCVVSTGYYDASYDIGWTDIRVP